jgi:hypothetical protein
MDSSAMPPDATASTKELELTRAEGLIIQAVTGSLWQKGPYSASLATSLRLDLQCSKTCYLCPPAGPQGCRPHGRLPVRASTGQRARYHLFSEGIDILTPSK